jgi:hypothetical protein
MFKSAVSEAMGDEGKYKELLQRISLAPSDDKSFAATIEGLAKSQNIEQIIPTDKIGDVDVTALNNAILGSDDRTKGLIGLIKGFIGKKNVDTEAIKSKAVICANF